MRWYSPSTGRWLSRDPVQEPGLSSRTRHLDWISVSFNKMNPIYTHSSQTIQFPRLIFLDWLTSGLNRSLEKLVE